MKGILLPENSKFGKHLLATVGMEPKEQNDRDVRTKSVAVTDGREFIDSDFAHCIMPVSSERDRAGLAYGPATSRLDAVVAWHRDHKGWQRFDRAASEAKYSKQSK